jgi:glutaredoxin domain-containing cysteine-rich protein 1
VLYFTTLRVVRKTFEDCRATRSILRGFRIPIDERDVSMDEQFLTELQEIIGCKNFSLPIVFIGGRYVGGAVEIRQLHESGELKKLISRLPVADPNACDLCGGLRFIVCERCDGSHKLYIEKIGFKSCTVCNVNGLIRCPCSSVLQRTPRNK